MEPGNGNLNQSTDEVQTGEFSETLDGSPTAPQIADKNELEILIISTLASFKIKNINVDRKKSLILSKIL